MYLIFFYDKARFLDEVDEEDTDKGTSEDIVQVGPVQEHEAGHELMETSIEDQTVISDEMADSIKIPEAELNSKEEPNKTNQATDNTASSDTLDVIEENPDSIPDGEDPCIDSNKQVAEAAEMNEVVVARKSEDVARKNQDVIANKNEDVEMEDDESDDDCGPSINMMTS